MNYLMRPDVMAGITNAVQYPNGNRASFELVNENLRNDPATYPGPDIRRKLHALPSMTPEQVRLETRLWTRFRTGQ